MKKNTHYNAIAAAMLAQALCALSAEPTAGKLVVNINSATAQELMYLPGIGAAKADAIIKYRTSHPFKKVEDLTQVKGIGRKIFKKLEPHLTISGETTAKGRIVLAG